MYKSLFCAILTLALQLTNYQAANLYTQMDSLHRSARELRKAFHMQAETKSQALFQEKLLDSFIQDSVRFSRELVRDGNWREFSREYLDLHPFAKKDFEFVISSLKAEVFQSEEEGLKELKLNFAKYFPGWGYAKDGYIYELRRELRREFLHAYWEVENRIEKTVENKKFKIDVKLLAKLKAAVPDLVVGAKSSVVIEGKLVFYYEVSFMREITIKTSQKVKKGVYRVWFELFEAKKPWPWQKPKWAYVGESYQNLTEPTSEAVVVDVDVDSII